MSALSAFGAGLRDLGGRTASASVIEAARLRSFDTLFAAHIGGLLEDAERVRGLSGPGLLEPIRLQVALIRSTEIDDIDLRSCVTAGSVVVPVALLLAGQLGCDDAAVASAMAAGYAAMIGLGRALGGAALLSQGYWPTYLVAPLGAAVTAASLLNLDEQGFADAMALALTRTPRFNGRRITRASPRFHLLGCAAAEGVLAAQAAAAGFGGDDTALHDLARDLGWPEPALLSLKVDEAAIANIDTKPFPTARQAQSAVEAFRHLLAQGLDLADIASVDVAVPTAFVAMTSQSALPPNRTGSLLSLACQLGLEATGGIDDATRQGPPSAELCDFIERVRISGAANLDALLPDHWAGRVRVALTDGTVREAMVQAPQGSAAHPFDGQALLDKASRIGLASGMAPGFLATLSSACEAFGAPGGACTAARLGALALR